MSAPFDWITPELAVGGCWDALSPEDLAQLGVGAVIDLRNEACDDVAALEGRAIRFLHLPTPDLHPPSQAMLDQGVDFAATAQAAGRRLLVHCQHGIGRSPLLALCIMVAGGAAPLDALAQLKDARACVSPSPAQYGAWVEWLQKRRMQTGAAWIAPDFEVFAALAYRHLAMT